MASNMPAVSTGVVVGIAQPKAFSTGVVLGIVQPKPAKVPVSDCRTLEIRVPKDAVVGSTIKVLKMEVVNLLSISWLQLADLPLHYRALPPG